VFPSNKATPEVVLLLYHCGFCPVEQEAINCTVPSPQVFPPVTWLLNGAGKSGFIVTVALADTGLVQLICVQVTVKVPAAVTVIELVVALFDHK
jgi:hypothetical protein